MTTHVGAGAAALAIRLPELDAMAPMDVAERLGDLPGLALLESGRPGRNARWTYLTADPVAVIDHPADGPDVFASARRALARLAPDAVARDANWPDAMAANAIRAEAIAAGAPPFAGGLVGYLSYDLGRRLERWPTIAETDQDLPLLRLALHDWVVAWDHRSGSAWLAGRALDGRSGRLAGRLGAVRERLLDPRPSLDPGPIRPELPTELPIEPPVDRRLELRSGLDRRAYETGVELVRAEIARGEIYQANLARRLETTFRGDPWPLYRQLRTGDPALFGAYLDLGPSPASGARRAILSASPEPFLSVTRDGRVASDPIKGTRPRGRDPEDDRCLAAELLASAKDRAENVMIVDVLRNDLGRVCVPGSVRVPRLCRLERTATVQHLVSTVVGRLAPDRDPFDLLVAAFPGGSITGAPKLRAIELLEALEPIRRGPYTGAAGWIGPDGAMQTSILIRTFVADGDRLSLHVGGGITWRSDPAAEWDETRAKAAGPLGAIDALEVDNAQWIEGRGPMSARR